jgi:hypothetical protein
MRSGLPDARVWTLADQEQLHVMHEQIPAGSCEKPHLHPTID